MKRSFLLFLILAPVLAATVRSETETIDLKALAKKARPAVMLLVVSDADGKEIATGTGFLVSSDGKLITNHHVIEGGASAVAKAENGGLFPVEGVLADDPKNDLVLLKLKGKDMPFLMLRKNEEIEVGTRIALIGSPLGLEGTLSEGIVSAVRELMGDIKLLQVTAAISPGSSGSPVLNAEGEVVGVATSLLKGGQALNFAMPIEYANRLLVKARSSTKPQPLQQLASSGEDTIYLDPDLRAAMLAEESEDYVELFKRAKILVGRYPDNALAHFCLGVAYHKLSFMPDAIAAFQQAIKLKPDWPMTWYELGVVYNNSKRHDDGITALRQAVKLEPDYAQAWFVLGSTCTLYGRADDAIAAFRQAIKLKPDAAGAWRGLSVAYLVAGREAEARDAEDRAKKLNPELFK